MKATVKYFYVSDPPEVATGINNVINPPTETKKKESEHDPDTFNPIFNFDQSFVDQMQEISSEEIGQAIPYVSLKIVNLAGEVIRDLNMEFFHKTIDLENITGPGRHTSRPTMSLKEIEISTDLASGYLYYTNISMKVRMHSPDFLSDSIASAFLIPGMPLLLEYGWNGNDKGSFLTRKEKLLFQVVNYEIGIDGMGQVDVTVNGMALNEALNNAYIGDYNNEEVKEGDKEKEGGTLHQKLASVEANLDHLQDSLDATRKGSRDYKALEKRLDTFSSVERKTRGRISKNFENAIKTLKNVERSASFGTKKEVPIYTFGELIRLMCGDTFRALTDIFPGINEFRVVFGNFNKNAGPVGGKSIADFPINIRKFRAKLKNKIQKGEYVLTVSSFLSLLVDEFMEDDVYIRTIISTTKTKIFNSPTIAVNFTNNGEVAELAFIDAKSDVPATTSEIYPKKKANQDTIEQEAFSRGIPVIRMGHANSFIKDASLSQVTDQYMKAALITRMAESRIETSRTDIVASQDSVSVVTPLTLPLQGSMNVLGHVGWKPFKSFFLSTGIYVVDAIYKITAVTHNLSHEGFKTNIDIFYH